MLWGFQVKEPRLCSPHRENPRMSHLKKFKAVRLRKKIGEKTAASLGRLIFYNADIPIIASWRTRRPAKFDIEIRHIREGPSLNFNHVLELNGEFFHFQTLRINLPNCWNAANSRRGYQINQINQSLCKV